VFYPTSGLGKKITKIISDHLQILAFKQLDLNYNNIKS